MHFRWESILKSSSSNSSSTGRKIRLQMEGMEETDKGEPEKEESVALGG